jgi:hypothetical protein
MLSTAIILGDHELASWIDGAVKTNRVVGKPLTKDVQDLERRLDAVTQPFREPPLIA